MGYKEYNIDSRYRLYGRYYNTLSETQNVNPFLAAHRTVLDSSSDVGLVGRYNHWKRLDQLSDVLAEDAAHDKYIPVVMQLVVPDGVGTAPHPIAVFIHGQAPTYFDSDDNPMSETKSYRGYRYLQAYLAGKGVASISVNVNVASFLEEPYSGHEHYEQQGRIHISFLALAAMRQVSAGAVTQGQQIFFKKSADSSLVPLQDALGLEPPYGRGTQEANLHALKTDIADKLDFTKLAFMGHSRGGDTVQVLQPYFTARTGTAPMTYGSIGALTVNDLPVPTGPYNSNTRRASTGPFKTNTHQYHAIHDTAAIFGGPTLTNLKGVVALQPSRHLSLLDSPTTFFLALASSHDEDVQEDSFNGYEQVNCPKAIIFSHGASHARFNSVWRQISGIRTKINRAIACQSPIHMLSNAGHENLSKVTIGNTMLATLLAQDHRYKFYTGELTAPSIGQDLERTWKFPYPMASPPALVLLDRPGLTATNTTTNAAVTITDGALLSDEHVNSNSVFANKVAVKKVTRPANQSLALRIPVTAADTLASRTHFSFRYTREYDARNASARRNVNLRGYTLRLKAGTNVIGTAITGAQVNSQAHRAYHTVQFSYEAPAPTHCYDDTMIIMQTAEVPLSQFLSNGQPVTDLNQVTSIEITLDAASGATGDATWFFVDFLLSTRNLPATPSGFAIP